MKRILAITMILPAALFAGNPDRTGEAGASELLINPWAQSSGWHGLNIASVQGLEATSLNVAGLTFLNQTQVEFNRTEWLVGSDIHLNTFGIAQKVGEGALALTLTSFNMGEIEVTTNDQPDGTGAFYKPRFSNFSLSYARKFADYLSGGITVRGISESISNAKAFGVAMDVGIQYITGTDVHPEQIKLGVALRNIGTPMRFSGDGLSFKGDVPDGDYQMTEEFRTQSYELPSLLTIGLSYDFYFGAHNRLTAVGNFISNSFYKDQFGVGLEYAFKVKNTEMFMVRAGYRYEDGILSDIGSGRTTAMTGLAAGVTFQLPVGGSESQTRLAINYSYRTTSPFDGCHAFGVRVSL